MNLKLLKCFLDRRQNGGGLNKSTINFLRARCLRRNYIPQSCLYHKIVLAVIQILNRFILSNNLSFALLWHTRSEMLVMIWIVEGIFTTFLINSLQTWLLNLVTLHPFHSLDHDQLPIVLQLKPSILYLLEKFVISHVLLIPLIGVFGGELVIG